MAVSRAPAAVGERRQRRREGHGACFIVRQLHAKAERLPVGVPADVGHPGQRLEHQPVRRVWRIGTGHPKRADRDVESAREHRRDPIRLSEGKPRWGSPVREQYVASSYPTVGSLGVPVAGRVERHAALAGVEEGMLRTAVQVHDIVGERSGTANAVAGLRLEADDLRAEEREQPPAVGDCATAGQLGHADAGKCGAWRLLPGGRHRKPSDRIQSGHEPGALPLRADASASRVRRGDSTVTPLPGRRNRRVRRNDLACARRVAGPAISSG